MQDIYVTMITLRDYYHQAHVLSKNVVYYGDHLLLQRLYEECDGYIDSLMEKMVGIGMGDMSIHLPTVYKKVFEKIKDLPYSPKENSIYFTTGETLEASLRTLCESLNKAEGTSVGVLNFIGDIADKSEGRTYLIKQRLSK
jgi:DNA-binding ferritin-like protein